MSGVFSTKALVSIKKYDIILQNTGLYFAEVIFILVLTYAMFRLIELFCQKDGERKDIF